MWTVVITFRGTLVTWASFLRGLGLSSVLLGHPTTSLEVLRRMDVARETNLTGVKQHVAKEHALWLVKRMNCFNGAGSPGEYHELSSCFRLQTHQKNVLKKEKRIRILGLKGPSHR
jgi:hypothetical protein